MRHLYLVFITQLLVFNCSTSQNNESSNFGILNPDAPKETIQYGQLIGEWDIIFYGRVNDSTWAESKANWIFKYILDGYAVQDYWTNFSDKEKFPQSKDLLGTNVRIYNPKLKEWQCVWIENGTNSIDGIWKSYKNEKDHIVLKDNNNSWVITFYNITSESFDWKWDFIQKDGSTQTNFKIKATKVN
ncbi:MAG: hypothetical protein AAF901_08450 [Bacteroidota bacterium]